jgi:sterol desaturase/sphingolipid hydroxylase (fatty acid hydroxylase superfamily)
MMAEARELFALLMAKVPLLVARLVSPGDVAGFLSVLLFALVVDGLTHRERARYRTRAFRVDIAYSLFYLSGIYTFFVGLPVFKLLTRIATSIAAPPQSPARLPVAAQIVIGLVIVDFFSYLWHRTVHTNRFLWAFHSVHHSQRYLTVATGFRTHFVDEIVRTCFIFVPLYALNMKPHAFVLMDLLMAWILGLQHSDLPWSYGSLGRLLVSPAYHQIHHSSDPVDRDKNFSVLFPVWDRLFRTAAAERGTEMRYGLAEAEYPESFIRQVAVPFIIVARSFTGQLRSDRPDLPSTAAGPAQTIP